MIPTWLAFKLATWTDVVSHYVPVLTPLAIKTFHWSEDLALSRQRRADD